LPEIKLNSTVWFMASVESPRSRAKREQIRDGALAAFLEQGFTATSTDAIASRAGVSKQTLYVYYRSTEHLLVDVLSTFVARIDRDDAGAARPVKSTRELRARLRELADHTVHALTRPDYLALVRVIIGEGRRVRQVGELWASTVPGRIRETVAGTLTAARTAGVIREVSVDAATRLFVGALLTYVLPDGLLADDPETVIPSGKELGGLVDLYLSALTREEHP
jgi:TetR/AcrR family transcriptional repressor of mexJK operon